MFDQDLLFVKFLILLTSESDNFQDCTFDISAMEVKYSFNLAATAFESVIFSSFIISSSRTLSDETFASLLPGTSSASR